MKRIATSLVALAMGASFGLQAQEKVVPVVSTNATSETTAQEVQAPAPVSQINWLTWDEMIKANEAEPRKIFIDAYTEWCGWCKRMDATTFKNPQVVEYMNKNYYAVKFDAERKDEIVFNDKTYKFVPSGRRGYHELAAELMNGKMSYPTFVILDEKFTNFGPIPGYKAAKDLEPFLKFVGDNHYQSSPWATYLSAFQAEFQ